MGWCLEFQTQEMLLAPWVKCDLTQSSPDHTEHMLIHFDSCLGRGDEHTLKMDPCLY
jgi:hypothetical protein